jgi:hypothetical protein
MKRFHVHVSVANLKESIGFYSTLFGTKPSVHKNDYAKWMLDDPRVNFAISSRGHQTGINHLGVQAETERGLAELNERAGHFNGVPVDKQESACCYAKSDKYWVVDPQGLAWENFYTLDTIPVFGEDSASSTGTGGEARCIPLYEEKQSTAAMAKGACCVPTTEGNPANAGACC